MKDRVDLREVFREAGVEVESAQVALPLNQTDAVEVVNLVLEDAGLEALKGLDSNVACDSLVSDFNCLTAADDRA